MKITIALRAGVDGKPEIMVLDKVTRWAWVNLPGSRFEANLPNKKKFHTPSSNVIYMMKEEDDGKG